MKVYYSLYSRMLNRDALYNGFKKVLRAKGAAGIDGQSLSDYAAELDNNLTQLQHELQTRQYRPLAVKRVEIPKVGGGVRLLGIPAVRDRIVQQVLLEILQPIFDPDFHPSSFGYRPGRCCHDVISKATMFIRQYNRRWVVDMDLSKCFDRLDHERIIEGVKFLGVEIGSRFTRLQDKKLQDFKRMVRLLTKRGYGWNLMEIIRRLNPVLRGFANYFSMANCSQAFKALAGWVRRRLRAIQLKLWKKPGRLHRRLKQLNYEPPFKFIKMNSWRNSKSPLASLAMPNKWFDELGLFSMDKVNTGWLKIT